MAPTSQESGHLSDGVRLPAVAGYFYAADPAELRGELDWCYAHPCGPGVPAAVATESTGPSPLAIIVPHAGIQYSGPFAAHAYRRLGRVRTAVILGPNHRGRGAPIALAPPAAWRTPLGDLQPDQELADTLLATCPEAQVDPRAHDSEHSLELQAIFLQHALGPDVRLVAIALAGPPLAAISSLGGALARVLADRPSLLVASTDLSHYLPDEVARARDRRTLAAIERLDVVGLLDLLAAEEATLCGAAGVVATLLAARELGATSATLLRQGTSGDTGGGRDSVVGYAALRVDAPTVG